MFLRRKNHLFVALTVADPFCRRLQAVKTIRFKDGKCTSFLSEEDGAMVLSGGEER